MPTVVVAMSGGVDSSVSAILMKEKGYDVIGVSLQLWDYTKNNDNKFGTCCSPDDLYDARRVAKLLDIPFYVINVENNFKESVVNYFIDDYINARTPNPCVKCNQFVKFDKLLQTVSDLGADYLVTGHYAKKIVLDNGYYVVGKACDSQKDQSYFLYTLKQSQLSKLLFPLGDLTKPEVREIARKWSLSTASKHESQELCFVPDNDYAGFIEKEYGSKNFPEGDIVDINGAVLGRHRGLHKYTIGQRKGLGISSSNPLYVVSLKKDDNTLVVSEDNFLYKKSLIAKDISWILGYQEESFKNSLYARIRYRGKDAKCSIKQVTVDSDSSSDYRYIVSFEEPQRAITPGQAIVFYYNDYVIGGGWIESADEFIANIDTFVV